MRSPTARGVLTLAVGAAGGLAFLALNLPLPWILGSLSATALWTRIGGRALSMPAGWRKFAMVMIGTMLGTGFTPDIISRAHSWLPSLMLMLVLSALFAGFAYAVFRRFGHMDRNTALFSAMPGGLSVTSLLAEQNGANVSRVALSHSARLVVLLVLAPVIIQLISGIDLADANGAMFERAEPIDPWQHGLLMLAAGLSWLIARRMIFLPSAMLLVPMAVSALLHLTGVLAVHVPLPLSALAQVIVGAGVGLRFAGYTLREILHDGWLAALVALGLALMTLLAAETMSWLIGVPAAPLFLAYLPGGAPELGIVALILGIDPAMVVTHHVLRIFTIVALLPLIVRLGDRRQHH
ncbi:MAG: AbrB family transcriptional regulator [Paracoccus sp. (in: a-proteobacteria)]